MRLRPLTAFAVTLAGLNSLIAQTVTYHFSGSAKSGSSIINSYFGNTATFDATVVYDPTSAATSTGAAAYGGQESTYRVGSMSITVHTVANGDWTAVANNSLTVTVTNDLYGDYLQFSAVGLSSPTVNGYTADAFNLVFGGSNTILNSTVVPGTIDLGAWDPYNFATQTYAKIYFDNYAKDETFRFTAATNAVPEPGTWGLLAGAAALGALLKRRWRAA